MADKKAGTQAGANDLVLRMVKQATPAAMFKAPAKPSVPKTPGTFSSMAVPTEEIAKAQKPKPKKITPWEVRQDAVRVVGKASKLTTPEDYTLLDQFLYINRESRTGEKISPTQSKVTAPAFGVTQDAVNRARMLARTPEGRAKMAAEVAEFRQARAFASGVKDVVALRGQSAPSFAASSVTPAQAAQLSAERQKERSFETSTSGRMSKSLEGVKKEVQTQVDPVMKILGQVIANVIPLDAAKPALAEMLRTLPVEQIAAIPQGITDLLASVDQESQIDAGKRIQMALMGGLNLVGGMAGAAELGGAATASRGLLKYGDDAIGGMVSGAAALKAARLKKAADKAAQTQGMVNKATTGTSRPTAPAVESNVSKLMAKQGPPLPPTETAIPQPSPRIQPETPTTAPVATPKAPTAQPAPIVAEKPPQAATQAIPESVPVSTTPPVSTTGKVAEAGKSAPADASARATARADASFRAKHGVGVGDEVTVTYQNGTTVEGTLSRNPAKARQGNEWMVGGKSIKPNAEGVTIKPKAQAVDAVSPTAPVSPKVETPAIPETPKPATGMEGLADRLAQRKAKLQEKLSKAPKAIKGKQAGATFGPERLVKEVDLFLTSAAEAAVRKGISLRKAIQELVMAEGRDAEDVAEINKALPKWADELGLDDEFINGAKATGKTADDDDFSLADAVTDRLMLDMGKMPTAAPAESVKSLFKKAEQAAKENPSAIDAVIADANATGRRMNEYEIAQATYRGQGVYRDIQAKAAELSNPSLSKDARAVLEAQKDALESQLQDIAWSVQPAKTGFANVGKAFQIMLSPKYDFRSMADRGVAANLGRKLADVQMQTIRDLSDNVLSLESDAAKTKAALLKMDAEALVNQTPDIIKAEKDLLAAQERFNVLKDNLTQIRKDKGSAQRKIRNAEKAIERAKTQLAEKSARLDSLIDEVPEKAKAARSRRSVSNDAKATKNRALSILKRFGLYSGEIESGAKAISGKQAGGFNADPKRIQAGIDKIKSWADFKDPESGEFVESAAQSAAGAVRSLMKLYLEEQYALGRFSVPIEEALTATSKMTDGVMDEDFILGLISGKYRAQVLEADVAKLRGNAYINGIKQAAQWGEASPLEKAGLFAADAFSGVSRAMKMSVDLSFGGIQGFKALTGGYAPEWARAYGKAWKTVRGGERAYLTSMAELAKNPGYKRAVKAGVSFSDAHTIDHAEEAFQSTIIDALHKKFGGTVQGVPIEMIKRSEYFHSAFGNELRLAMFNKMDGGSAKTPQELENIADLVNIITWRGALKKGQKVNPIISHLLVTARGYLSQWQDVTLKPLRKAIVKGDSAGAERALKYYANRVAKLAGIGYLASFFGWEFDNDPRSGRVGWLRHPGMKIDLNLVGDELQWIRALVQGSYGAINTKGEVGRKPDTPLDPMFRTLGGKLTPGARIATEAMAGSFFDFTAQEEKKLSFKDPLGLAQWFAKQYVPISVGAGWETGKELITNPDKSAGAKKGAMMAGDLVGVRMSDAKNRVAQPVKGFWNLETIGKHPLITGEGIPDIEGPKSGASKPKESSVAPYKSPRRAKGGDSFGKAFPS